MNNVACINEFLSISGAECSHNDAVEGGMIQWLWELLDSDRASAARRLRREQELELFRQTGEREADDLHRREKDDADFVKFVLLSDATRRANEELSRDIEDAITATRSAYHRAVVEEEQAREALEQIRLNAITLPDGSHVYFDRYGHLHGDDFREITDESVVAAAHRIQSRRPDASTFEIYAATVGSYTDAHARVSQLADLLSRLDELKALQESGSASPEELQRRRESLDRILANLPPDALADLNQLKTGRVEDSKPVTTSSTFEQFKRAADASAKETSSSKELGSDSARAPAYKQIPSF